MFEQFNTINIVISTLVGLGGIITFIFFLHKKLVRDPLTNVKDELDKFREDTLIAIKEINDAERAGALKLVEALSEYTVVNTELKGYLQLEMSQNYATKDDLNRETKARDEKIDQVHSRVNGIIKEG